MIVWLVYLINSQYIGILFLNLFMNFCFVFVIQLITFAKDVETELLTQVVQAEKIDENKFSQYKTVLSFKRAQHQRFSKIYRGF